MAQAYFIFSILSLFIIANSWVSINCSIAASNKTEERNRSGRESLGLRVVGGWRVRQKEHPFLALIYYADIQTCGGSVISNHFVLTAAHCVPARHEDKHYTVYLGVHDQLKRNDANGQAKRFSVRRIIKHEKYQALPTGVLINDIALMELDRPVKFNSNIQSICIPKELDLGKYHSGNVAGWGSTNANVKESSTSQFPMQTTLAILSDQECYRTPVHPMLKKVPNIYHMVFCAYKKNTDSCQGDSGGPIYAKINGGKAIQLGVVSFGVGCGRDGYPGLYTRISSYTSWLKKYVHSSCSV